MIRTRKSLKPGDRVKYWWNNKRLTGRFIRQDGGYYYFMRGPGTFSPNAQNVVELYHVEFTIL